MKARKNVVEPSHWPKQLRYTQIPTYHSSISLEIQNFIKKGPRSPQHSNSFHNHAYVTIRHINDPLHPANNQFGLFALKKIPARAYILNYIGEIHADERLTSDYDLSLVRLQDGVSIGIDASTTGNEARFINDYRGIKVKPNAVFIDYRTDSGELRMGIWAANEDIKKGDELLVSYGKAWWKARTGQLL